MKIDQAYDAIIAKCKDLFPSKARLHNPYELSDNPELVTKDAWGLKVSSASRESLDFCNISITRSFTFILTRHFPTVGAKEDAFDEVSKSLLMDQQTFMNSLFSSDELGIGSIIDIIDFETISGIGFIQTDKKNYLFCEIGFKITLSDQVN
jgi:hypothetical protein